MGRPSSDSCPAQAAELVCSSSRGCRMLLPAGYLAKRRTGRGWPSRRRARPASTRPTRDHRRHARLLVEQPAGQRSGHDADLERRDVEPRTRRRDRSAPCAWPPPATSATSPLTAAPHRMIAARRPSTVMASSVPPAASAASTANADASPARQPTTAALGWRSNGRAIAAIASRPAIPKPASSHARCGPCRPTTSRMITTMNV